MVYNEFTTDFFGARDLSAYFGVWVTRYAWRLAYGNQGVGGTLHLLWLMNHKGVWWVSDSQAGGSNYLDPISNPYPPRLAQASDLTADDMAASDWQMYFYDSNIYQYHIDQSQYDTTQPFWQQNALLKIAKTAAASRYGSRTWGPSVQLALDLVNRQWWRD